MKPIVANGLRGYGRLMTLNDRSSALALLETRRSGKPRELVEPGPSAEEVERILTIAARAPDHGKLAPWRFVIVEDDARRAAIRASFESCNKEALAKQDPDRASLYARLKLAGLDDAPCQVSVFSDRATAQGSGLGRATMPETLDYSVVTAIHTLWLAARAEGLGLGWVSILDPKRMTAILDLPPEWVFIGHLCIGTPLADDDTPALERAGWERRAPTSHAVLYR